MKMRGFSVVVLLSLLLTACAGAGAPAPVAGTPPRSP